MTRDDDSQRSATTARHKPAKSKRTKGVGRTGARFPSASVIEVEEPTTDPPADNVEPVDDPATLTQQSTEHNALPGAPAPAPHPSTSSSDPSTAPSSPTSSATSSATADPLDVEPAGPTTVGGTGARFGPYSVRKRTKEFAADSAPVAVEQAPVEVPPGEPTPEQSAERTVQLVKPWAGALVRPYAHTGGRTRSSHDLALEALISSRGRTAAGEAVLTTHHMRVIVDLCTQPRSVAEVAALLSVPLGVARVLLGDLAAVGVVDVHPTAGNSGDGAPDVAFMRRVLVGLRRL